MDQFDRRILDCLQRDNRRTTEAMAEEIGLSASAIHRRIAKLRAERVIIADSATIDPKAVGLTMTFIVEISLERVRVDEVTAFKKRLRAAAEVQQCYNVTGDGDLLLIMLARDVEHFESISARLFSSDQTVRRYRTSVVMDRVKVGLSIPIDTN